MIISNKRSIEDLIVETLAQYPYSEGPKLVALLQKPRPYTTKQAVYSALKSLIDNETIAKVGSKYFLSRQWLFKINQLFHGENQLLRDAIFSLRDRQSISYRFPSLLTCDTYWAHVFSLLIEWSPKDRPIFIWNPHEWFMIGREEAERNIFREFQIQDKFAFYTVQGKTALDKQFRDTWANDHVVVTVGSPIPYERNYYLNIFNDFIIEVFIARGLADKFEDFYASNQTLTDESVKEFENLIAQKYAVRMKISRKHKKASQLRKRLAKPFFIPKNLQLN